MISIAFDTVTKIAKLTQPPVIKVGADVPVRITFSAAPGEVADIQLALGSDTAAPTVLAFAGVFVAENETTWTALLDASDSRLITHMSGKGTTQVQAELVCLLNGERLVSPNMPVTVQPRVIGGPETSNGGPTYLTEAQSDGRYLAKDDAQWSVTMIFFGEAVVAQIFAGHRPMTACKIVGLELSAQVAPVGADLTVELVDGAGASLGRSVTLPAGQSFVRTTFAELAVIADAIVRGKITAIGSGSAGAFLNLRLLISL